MTIFERVDALETSVTGLITDLSNLRKQFTSMEETLDQVLNAEEDTGWLPLTLQNGVEAYSTNQVPQYRKVGKIVFVRGAVKNITARDTVIATLPAGFRPVGASHTYVQNTSQRTGNFAMYSRMIVNTSGAIKLEGITDGAAYGDKWFPIGCSFVVD